MIEMLKTNLYIPEEINKEITSLAESQKTSKAEVMRQALRKGLEEIKKKTASAKMMFRVADIGEEYQVEGPEEASQKMDEQLWDKEWRKDE